MPKRNYSKRNVNIALKWAKGELKLIEVVEKLKLVHRAAAYPFLALALKQYLSDK